MRIRLTATVVLECDASELFISRVIDKGIQTMQLVEEEDLSRKGAIVYLDQLVNENEWGMPVRVKVEEIQSPREEIDDA